MKKYSVEGQNILCQWTENGRVMESIIAVATSTDNAITIVAALRVIFDLSNDTKTKKDEQSY